MVVCHSAFSEYSTHSSSGEAVSSSCSGSLLNSSAILAISSSAASLGILVSLWLWGLKNADKDGRLMSADRDDVLESFSVKLIGKLRTLQMALGIPVLSEFSEHR